MNASLTAVSFYEDDIAAKLNPYARRHSGIWTNYPSFDRRVAWPLDHPNLDA